MNILAYTSKTLKTPTLRELSKKCLCCLITSSRALSNPQAHFGSVTLAGRYVPLDLDESPDDYNDARGGGKKRRRTDTGESVDIGVHGEVQDR